MISILVTYYNQEEFVSRSLDSVFSQVLNEDFEVLVGDDGSSDGTCKIVQQYMEKYPNKIKLNIQSRDLNIIYNPVERASRNRLDLLKIAKGDFICFLDGDDEYCDNNWIQESIDILKKDLSLAGVAHNYCEKYSDGRIVNPLGIGGYEYISSKIYCRKLYTHVGAIVFRNNFAEYDYDKLIKLKSFDDNDITLYFLNYGNLFCNKKIVYSYYQNDNSIWHSTNELEKSLINAIDYEILKQILKKYHFQLFLKYYVHVYNCYKSRNIFSDDRYFKYKTQVLNNGAVAKLLEWDKLRIYEKFLLNIKFVSLKFFQKVLCKIC